MKIWGKLDLTKNRIFPVIIEGLLCCKPISTTAAVRSFTASALHINSEHR